MSSVLVPTDENPADPIARLLRKLRLPPTTIRPCESADINLGGIDSWSIPYESNILTDGQFVTRGPDNKRVRMAEGATFLVSLKHIGLLNGPNRKWVSSSTGARVCFVHRVWLDLPKTPIVRFWHASCGRYAMGGNMPRAKV